MLFIRVQYLLERERGREREREREKRRKGGSERVGWRGKLYRKRSLGE
jgi:hypothetical protein